MYEKGYAVVARAEDDGWRCYLLPAAVLANPERLLTLSTGDDPRRMVVLVNVADAYVLAARFERGSEPRLLLSDATAALDSALARAVLDRVDAVPSLGREHIWPAGDLTLFADLGVDAPRLRRLLDNGELTSDELLGYLAESLGFGSEYAVVVDGLPGTLTT